MDIKPGISTLSLGERVVRSLWRAAPQRVMSDAIGWGARQNLPRAVRLRLLKSFAAQYGIDVAEAEKPLEDYAGLQEFFTRRLRAGLRPVEAAEEAVVSPSDGTVVEMGLFEPGMKVDAKAASFTLAELLADPPLAALLQGGAYAITYLSPRDYHRVHAPTGGRIVAWRHVPGRLFPVNDRSVAREVGLFAKNERFVTVIDGPAGLCAVVMVAAVGVGHITAAYDAEVATHARAFAKSARKKQLTEGIPVGKGDELGVFNLGSTTIVLFQPGRVALDTLPSGQAVRMGSRLGRILPTA